MIVVNIRIPLMPAYLQTHNIPEHTLIIDVVIDYSAVGGWPTAGKGHNRIPTQTYQL